MISSGSSWFWNSGWFGLPNVNVHQGNQCCIWFSFKLVVGEFLKQKQCWAKAWLIDFEDYFRCYWKMKDKLPYQVLFKSTLLLETMSKQLTQLRCRQQRISWVWVPSIHFDLETLVVLCGSRVIFCIFGCGSCMWRVESTAALVVQPVDIRIVCDR